MSAMTQKQKSMTVADLKVKAQALGLKLGKIKKTDLVHAIQNAENNTPCFGTCNGQCQETNCCFITDCEKIK